MTILHSCVVLYGHYKFFFLFTSKVTFVVHDDVDIGRSRHD